MKAELFLLVTNTAGSSSLIQNPKTKNALAVLVEAHTTKLLDGGYILGIECSMRRSKNPRLNNRHEIRSGSAGANREVSCKGQHMDTLPLG
ncbi:hypothetical protein ABB27_11955 [Stenotrophomonas terrae]|uniref:Uncharacterized protein n=1 Tax=Stenotrophomonas terrae TaxID=405446 RepID=A0A0R0CBM5_9GAMM|nr:hypothetical protein ABB27_11955 [Stenotrophomonas terrae]